MQAYTYKNKMEWTLLKNTWLLLPTGIKDVWKQ